MRNQMLDRWRRLPAAARKPIVFILGFIFIIGAALTGWLPGPGGIPLFLLGIAILATEFAWAERIQRPIMTLIKRVQKWYGKHRKLGNVLLFLAAVLALSFLYISFRMLNL